MARDQYISSLDSLPLRELNFVLRYLALQLLASGFVPIGRRANVVVQYHKNFRFVGRLKKIAMKSHALSLLKTQYAKKPKNPV
ncbi:MAG TPA: hypothetical protein VG738_19165 [Chitinophagaceae bacterium]|nr:hypothetical protein [Chitinophagaceae bacterium]